LDCEADADAWSARLEGDSNSGSRRLVGSPVDWRTEKGKRPGLERWRVGTESEGNSRAEVDFGGRDERGWETRAVTVRFRLLRRP
jgi:hypothetical protein